ncbi:hypothetical protein BKA70DRAFT_1427474 [Coprinopsis sp. MPI-PUGE-AT-0042]|nr:hypothetical protein BKA70DRAFT_1427474 [Coprinopsis sp. MPI-PUGE-AT-0042]
MRNKRRQKGSSARSANKSAASPNALHHLKRAIFDDLLPTDDATRGIWGFNRAAASPRCLEGSKCLLIIYQNLVNDQGIDPEQLDQWRQKGILLPEIKKVLEAAIPEEKIEVYYFWLLKHEYILDRSQPIPPSDPAEIVRRAMRSGWNYATNGRPATDDEIRTTILSWPFHRNECVVVCGWLLHWYPPPPHFALWLHFGFCVGNRQSEMAIVGMYRKLLDSTSFDEFHQAYENAQLVELLRKKGLTQSVSYRQVADEFEDVVDGSAKDTLKSAWQLKAFIRSHPDPLQPGEGVDIERSVCGDYGFANCRYTQDFNQLLRIYQEYFNSPTSNCLALHSACVDGKLAEYLQKCPDVTLGKDYEPLFKNLYPLPPLDALLRSNIDRAIGQVYVRPVAKPEVSRMFWRLLVAFLVIVLVYFML